MICTLAIYDAKWRVLCKLEENLLAVWLIPASANIFFLLMASAKNHGWIYSHGFVHLHTSITYCYCRGNKNRWCAASHCAAGIDRQGFTALTAWGTAIILCARIIHRTRTRLTPYEGRLAQHTCRIKREKPRSRKRCDCRDNQEFTGKMDNKKLCIRCGNRCNSLQRCKFMIKESIELAKYDL